MKDSLPFPKPEESSSRYVTQRARTYKDESGYDSPNSKIQTWRRILLINCIKEMRVEDMPPLLADTLIDKVLFADRIKVHQFLEGLVPEWARDSEGSL